MAVNESRSMNGDLVEGLTDGTVKKIAPNRGGELVDISAAELVYANLLSEYYDPSFSVAVERAVARRLTTLRG